MTATNLWREIDYPESDGTPMGETGFHVDEIIYLREAFKERFSGVSDVYVGANMFFYYVQGDLDAVVAPDVFVVKGVPGHQRRIYKLWEEGRVPCLIVEVTSKSSRKEDLAEKKPLYERLGVQEYVLHDPLGEYLQPRLQGFRLVRGRYQPIPSASGSAIRSRTAGVTFKVEANGLRLVDSTTGEPILSGEETRAARRVAEERASAAEERASTAEEEIARLRAELERLRGQS